MGRAKRCLRKIIKIFRKTSLQSINNGVTYSIGTRCTGKEKLPKMKNNNYILFYGMTDSIYSQELNEFKVGYNKKPFELFIDAEYVKKRIVEKQREFDNDSEIGNVVLNYVGIAIKRCKVLDTSTVAENIEKAYKNKYINVKEEKRELQKFSLSNGYQVYSFAPQYVEINPKSSVRKLVKPASYIIVDTDIIVSIAIGVDNINKMVNSYNKAMKEEAVIEQKQAKDAEQEKIRRQAEIRKSGREAINTFNELAQKVDKSIGNIFKK